MEHYLTREPTLVDHTSYAYNHNSVNVNGHVNVAGPMGHGTITSMLGLASPTRREPNLHSRRRAKMALHSRFTSKPRGRAARQVASVRLSNCNSSALFSLHSYTLDGQDQSSLLHPSPDVPVDDYPSGPPTPPSISGERNPTTTVPIVPTTTDSVATVCAVAARSNGNGIVVRAIGSERRSSLMENLTHSWSELSTGNHRQSLTFPITERQDVAAYRHSVHSFPSSVDV
ncbi:unnamed protein product [Echinostoma caproni]|uniref:Pecanex-like protein n=1 Tax=Echinostoma caproni TaxID=27848 RepID=A0A183BAJ9_9TREM|nr:unnamed protein product [Echinostoma caproni]